MFFLAEKNQTALLLVAKVEENHWTDYRFALPLIRHLKSSTFR